MHAGALSVPMCLAIATGLWVWVLPETKGIALPTLENHALPTTASTTAASGEQQGGREEWKKR